jgi:hypothetical protein
MMKCGAATSGPKGRPDEWLHHYGGWSHLGRALWRGSSALVEQLAQQACVGRHVHALQGGYHPLSQRGPRCVPPMDPANGPFQGLVGVELPVLQ